MKLEYILDGLHVSITRRWWLQLFTAFTRVLLAVGFVPPSIPKILHRPFTILPDSDPVGAYFGALYNTGFYYEFIGWAQLTAALLLIIPRTAHIGALMFLPIIVNISVLTISVGFKGTWVITLLMCFAAAWLVVWEYDRLKPVLFRNREGSTRRMPYQFIVVPMLFALGGIAMPVIAKLLGLGNLADYVKIGFMLAIIGLIFGAAVAVHYKFMPAGALEPETKELI